ncbi:Hsp90 cochaperone shq1 [Podochytrium sp. JEL0797]|nr:Hsp90 cochaperone shq1 [Podochytrium sp. JEL0797]
MLTPLFSVSQTDDAVLLTIKTPYVKAKDIEFHIDACEFKLHIHPYFLRLTFPFAVVENGKETARYDVGKGEIYVSLPKLDPGKHFPDLDMLSKLMMPKGFAAALDVKGKGPVQTGVRPMIEEMETGEEEKEGGEGSEDEDEMEEDFDWEIPQELPESDLLTGVKYGFNNAYSGFASHVAELGRDIIDISDVDHSTPASRRAERIEKEDAKFDEDYYMSDFINVADIQHLLQFKPEFRACLKQMQQSKITSKPLLISEIVPAEPAEPVVMNMISSSGTLDMQNMAKEHAELLATMMQNESSTESAAEKADAMDATLQTLELSAPATSETPPPPSTESWKPDPTPTPTTTDHTETTWLTFTPTETQEMISLPRRHLLAPTTAKPIYLGLVDLAFAYCYDHRTTEGDSTVESAWTMAKVSPTLSCFETFTSLNEVLVACMRRALAYPLYRNMQLITKVIQDVSILFKLGKRALLKVVLSMRRRMRLDDACFVFDRLYLEDYCLWIQGNGCSEKVVRELGSEVNHYEVQRGSVGWGLEGLEELAREIENEDREDEEEAGE